MIGKDESRGTWFVQIKVKDPLTGKWRTHKKHGFSTKREAKQYEASISTTDEIPTSKTFLQMAHEWRSPCRVPLLPFGSTMSTSSCALPI
ncbi:MAG: Arm DNA-binding domain-containing protein [Erysipelotrichaceae bacterium]|jgi:hypothetical protein|nr:Arm DNA-binding domain-containing protein [Erysipelotrichaceae bacterium]MCH4044731.1 Arm DNA-binding domain-containing protein [Erysipelotrichaceae bacterium]MCH4121943.1 Arm DNA-binding domain-containing protein [Erysipelotrichaceae bacterium]